MPESTAKLAPVTIVIEWENAIDVDDEWTHRAMRAFEAEMERCRDLVSARPRVMYLYDETRVEGGDIRATIEKIAPRLPELCELELVPTLGLTYYKLKNYGVSRTSTELVIMLDSDAAPQPGWLPNLLAPFEDPEVMAVGGFTVLGCNDLLSRVMALIWIFHMRSERVATKRRKKINANNCAFRTAFFQANPWPDLPAFKKQCGFWLRDIDKRGVKWVRTVEAMTVHAPHPGFEFLAWRAWTAGLDRDFQACQTVTPTRLGRLGYALWFWVKKSARSTSRIITKGREVDLPVWQMPAALAVAYWYHTIMLAGELWGAATRSYRPLNELWKDAPLAPDLAAASKAQSA